MADILAMLRLHESIEAAINTGAGDYGSVLTIVRNYQEGRFDEIDWKYLATHQVTPDGLTEMNNQSISWYQSLSGI
jgi:c-di-GMP-related signal transduction protein